MKGMKNTKWIFLFAVLYLSACTGSDELSDAYGTFEATELTVSAEVQGKLLNLQAEEGRVTKKDEVLGLIDTIDWVLKRDQLLAQRQAIASKYPGVAAQMAVQEQQLKNLTVEKDRLEKLYKDGAATGKQLDDINGSIDVVQKQISSIGTQNSGVAGELGSLQAQIEQIEENLKRCRVTCPIEATVVDKYCEPGEMVSPGRALFKVADLSELYLRVYLSGAQLPKVKLGQKVEVLVDKDQNENTALSGEVCWISSTAEFTPKIIQTKEERVNLVYAVKVRVKNDGSLKIGMPGEIRFR
jgi:HlyD family secretion protein